jgi:3-deoxy-D-manno-octulosonate 8-phosphate phosphatase (KDO 8-P phosphatase)
MTNHIIQSYEQLGGVFITPPSVLVQKLSKIKALVFDWDGVFNDGRKTQSSGSGFSEVDSMGINMLRFSLWLKNTHGARIKTIVITGEHNPTAFSFAKREGFDAVYYQMKDKTKALAHFCSTYAITADEAAFFFDDILDLSLAQQVGLRFQLKRASGIAFNEWLASKSLADYASAGDGGSFGLREVCELCMSLNGSFDEVVAKRMLFEGDYTRFITQRNEVNTAFYTLQNGEMQQVPEPLG